jgi:hypothetical protein
MTNRLRFAVVIFIVATLGCASGLKLKRRVSQAHLTAHSLIMTLDVLEDAACKPDPAPADNHCTAVPVILTDAQHQRFSQLLAQAAEADARVGRVIILWNPDTPKPTDLASLTALAQQIKAIAEELAPSSKAVEILKTAIDLLNAALQIGGV